MRNPATRLFRLWGMRRLHTTVGAGVMLVALAACAGGQDDVGFGGKPPAPPGPVEPKPEAQRTPVPPKQLPPDSVGEVWTQDGGTVVVAEGQEGGCSKVHAEAAQQDQKQVKIVLVNEEPEPAGACTMDIRYKDVGVRLDAPLDQRNIVIEERDVKVPK